MPTGLYTRRDYNEETQKVSRLGKIEFEQLKILLCHNFKQPDQN